MTIEEVQNLVAYGRQLLSDPTHDTSDQMSNIAFSLLGGLCENVAILVERGKPAVISPLYVGEQTNG